MVMSRVRVFAGALLMALLVVGWGPAGAKLPDNPVLSKRDAIKARQRFLRGHATDVTVAKLYDHLEWIRKQGQVAAYALSHEPTAAVEASGFSATDTRAVFELRLADGSDGILEITFPEAGTVRVRAGQKKPEPDAAGLPLQAVESEGRITLSAEGAMVVVELLPLRLSFATGEGVPVLAEPEDGGLALGDGLVRERLSLAPGEVILGGGEQYGWWNHVGHEVINDTDDAYQTRTGNTYIPTPFFISSRGYGLLLDTYRMARFDFGRSKPGVMFFEDPGPGLDYRVYLSDDPRAIITNLTARTGRAQLVPRWSLEPWLSRRTWLGWRYSKGADADVDRMVAQGFPLGVIMYECMTMSNELGVDFQVNREEKPDMPALIDRWHSMGIKVVGYHREGQLHNNPQTLAYYGFDRHPEYLVRGPDGTPYQSGWGGDKVFLDVTNPLALDYAWQRMFEPLFSAEPDGSSSFAHLDLDGTKVDFGEFFPPDSVPLIMHDRRPGMRLRHPTILARWLYERINAIKPDGGITWVRGAGPGAQTTGIVWAGDRGRTFVQFRTTIRAGLQAAASGISLWGTDLGGYTGGGLRAEEVYNRAAAFSAFSLTFHDHGAALAPWEQSERGRDIYRFYARLHYNLLPYLYDLVNQAHDTGLPVLRPMFMACPHDRTCWDLEDQYLLGESILAAPVVEPSTTRKLYLPAGEWMDFFTRERFAGPTWIYRDAPRETMPVFVRMNSAIPVDLGRGLQPGCAFTQAEKDHLTPGLLVYGGADFDLKGQWKGDDPRRGLKPPRAIAIRRSGDEITVDAVTPAPAVVLVYGSRPSKVSYGGSDLPERDCSGMGPMVKGWCFREEDRAAVITAGP